jgi:XTP/dITP diphosphohydrolase
MQLVFATHNKHKLEEVKQLLDESVELLSLTDIQCFDDIPETKQTLEENASDKARYVYEKYGYNCFADDTGLEVEALQMKPGVFSARYAGEQKNSDDNMNKLLLEMHKIKNRNARFRTVISLIVDGYEKRFEGIVNGTILENKYGEKGFGYDPVFQPKGYSQSFAQLPLGQKNKISHRGLAVKKLTDYLKKTYK